MKWATTLPPAGGVVASIDFETTGLEYAEDRIVQIGVVVARHGTVVDEWSCSLNPQGRRLNPRAAAVNGLDDDDLAREPLVFGDVAEELESRTDGALVIAHRLPFEVRFWAAECDRAGRKRPHRAGMCTRMLAFAATDTRAPHLRGALKRLGVDCSDLDMDAHDALVDAHAAWRLFRHIQADMGWKSRLRLEHDANINDDMFDLLDTTEGEEIAIYKAAKRGAERNVRLGGPGSS